MKRLLCALILPGLIAANMAQAQVLTEWVESRANGETNKIALGYPVPVPVDTPLPFAGFRSYAGLHLRHLDLAATTPRKNRHYFCRPHHLGLPAG